MKTLNACAALTAVIFCLLLTQRATAQTHIYGYASTHYDEATGIVTSTATTNVDYSAQDFYKGRVNLGVTDKSTGQVVASAYAWDIDRDGTVTVTTQNGSVYEREYEAIASHYARYEVQDYAIGAGYYIDYWAFEPRYSSEGDTIGFLYVPYFAYGPRYTSRRTGLQLGRTAAATIALNMPAEYTPGQSSYDSLTPAEKRFVRDHPVVAATFQAEREWVDAMERDRFPTGEIEDGARSNAFRHASWSAFMALRQGATLAREFGDAHEAYTATGRETQFRDMDLYNNGVGLTIQANNPNASRPQLADLVMQALTNGGLRVICPPTCRGR